MEKKDAIEPLKAALKEAAAGIEFDFEVSCSIGIGAKMGVIENQTNLRDEEKVNVTHKEGEVILLDFWATWCPPCQGPMAHNQEMLEKRGKDWGDKVRLIGLSIDQDQPTLVKHVDDKKWTSVEHYWSRNGVSTADKIYGVQGVPHCLLVDTHGTIVFIGHPANRNLEEDIDNLLKDVAITGKGCEPAGAAAGDAKELKADDYAKWTTLFKDEAKKIVESQKGEAAKLQRAFLVMVVEATYNAASGKMTGEMQVITQLFGDPSASGKIHAECKKLTDQGKDAWLCRDMIR